MKILGGLFQGEFFLFPTSQENLHFDILLIGSFHESSDMLVYKFEQTSLTLANTAVYITKRGLSLNLVDGIICDDIVTVALSVGYVPFYNETPLEFLLDRHLVYGIIPKGIKEGLWVLQSHLKGDKREASLIFADYLCKVFFCQSADGLADWLMGYWYSGNDKPIDIIAKWNLKILHKYLNE